MKETRDYLQLHFIVLLWGFTAILGLLISIPAVELVFYRTLLAFFGLLALLFFMKVKVLLDPTTLFKLILTGFIFAGHWILFFAAARQSNVSVTLVGMSTVTLWTAFLEPITMKKRIKWFEVVLGLIIVGGIYLIFEADLTYRKGLLMAMGSAFLAALFTVINARFVKEQHPYVITCWEMLGATIATLLFFPIYLKYFAIDGVFHLQASAMDWFYILVLAFICTVYAYSASVQLMKRLSAYTINLVINLEPVYGIILAILIFGDSEKMTSNFYVGAIIIILAVLSYPLMNKWSNRKALETDNLR
jgi:drug/metabolite transporter (DMT)-like permease